MTGAEEQRGREELSREQKRHRLFLAQKETLDTLREHGAITQAQHDKSLRDLREKMGMTDE